MNFIHESIQDYAEAHTAPESPLLYELARDTHLKTMYPRMLSGHLQGRILSLFSKIHRPETILEIGTFTGYATLCLAEGLVKGGKVYTLEIDPEVLELAKSYFQRSAFSSQILPMLGDALQLISEISDVIDLAFIDGEKEQYEAYYEAILPKMKPGGLFIVDNVLWSGQVVDPAFQDASTVALRNFNAQRIIDARVEPLLLPVRDGLFLLRKN